MIVRDGTGAPLGSSREWGFATEAFLLDAQVPADASLTELQTPIAFTFALPMDRASVQSALTISPRTPGDLVWADDDRMVTFQPDPGWLSGVDYEVVLAGEASTADQYQTLGEAFAWSFTTGVAEIQFGEGAYFAGTEQGVYKGLGLGGQWRGMGLDYPGLGARSILYRRGSGWIKHQINATDLQGATGVGIGDIDGSDYPDIVVAAVVVIPLQLPPH